MTEEEALQIIKKHVHNQFPKICNCCGKKYKTFFEFITSTKYVGPPISYDLANEDFRPKKPIGTLGYVNCKCGSTIALSSQGIKLRTLWKLFDWARKETKRKGISFSEFLSYVRERVDKSVLYDHQKENT